MLTELDVRAIPTALRTVADAVGGMAALAERTKLSPATIYRTLSANGSPRLTTVAFILEAFGLCLTVTRLPLLKAKTSSEGAFGKITQHAQKRHRRRRA